MRRVCGQAEGKDRTPGQRALRKLFNDNAARLLDLHPWVLRGERLRGRITASKIVGRRIRYEKTSLLSYLAQRRIERNGNG